MKKFFMKQCLFFIFILSFVQQVYPHYNLNLLGWLKDIQSISRHTSSYIDCLPSDINIKLFRTKACSPKDFRSAHRKILTDSVDLRNPTHVSSFLKRGEKLSGMTIYTDSQWYNNSWSVYKSLPNNSTVKYAYCVTERTEIPQSMVSKFNNNFDGVIVVDEWLIDVCKNSGVKIPVFSLPLALDLHSLLSKPAKKNPTKPFVFGFSGIFWPRKNQELLMKAFDQEFKNDPNVSLILHGRFEQKYPQIKKILRSLRSKNITAIQKAFSRSEYEQFLMSLDCYVILSKAEGFSITPREALALGIPSILSNNTAHKVICKNNLVYAVPSNIKEPSFCYTENRHLGYEFNCDIKDVRKALREVYKNYQHYYERAQRGREWVKLYLAENLHKKYLNLVRPQKVVLGPINEITDNYLMTNSRVLFNKYKELCKSTDTKFEVLIK